MRYISLAFLLIIFSCKNLSLKTENAIPLEEVLTEYPSDHLSIKDPFIFSFKDTLSSLTVINEAITISPKIDVEITKLNPNTLAVYPKGMLEYDTDYSISFLLSSILSDFNQEGSIFITVKTKPLNFDYVPNEAILYSEEFAKLTGTIYSSDWVDPLDVEAMISTVPESSSIFWNHSLNGKIHNFEINNIKRGQVEDVFQIKWSDKKGRTKTETPYLIKPKGEFKLTNVTVNRENKSIALSFSDPVLKPQRLEGLISLQDSEPLTNFSIVGSTISIFLDDIFSNQQNIIISEHIKGKNGKNLGGEVIRSIQFDPVVPEVRLVGNGIITPYQDVVIFPFESRGLSAVDVEILKIFENNVLQYLQNNQLNDRPYYLEQVGRIIHQEKISLTKINTIEDLSKWSRHTLDLQQLTSVEPGALYVVRIGFRRSYAIYPCDNGLDGPPLVFNPDEPQSIMRWPYGYEGYHYSHESNPCYPAFYNENHFIQRNLLASNLGIIVKKGLDNKLVVYANDLNTTLPTADASVSIYDYQKQNIAHSTTDQDGRAEIILEKDPSFLIINKGMDYGYLNIKDQYANSLTDFEIGGLRKEKGVDGYIYGERGVWRPGDTLFLTFALEDRYNIIPDDHPVVLYVKDSRGQLKYNATKTVGVAGLYSFEVPTDISDITGSWTAIATIGNNSFSKRIRVETIKPNRLKINLDLPENPILESNLEVPLAARWLHGAVAGSLKANVDVSFQSIATTFPGFGSYTFSDPARRIEPVMTTVFSGLLDNQGRSTINIKRGNNFLPPGKVMMRSKTRVFEPSGEFSEDNFSVEVHPYNAYVGIKTPKSRWGYNLLEKSSEDEISILILDDKGRPLPNKEIQIGLYEAEWQWWYSRSSSNIYKYDASDHIGASEKAIVVTDNSGVANWRPSSLDAYRYLVRVCDSSGGHCSGLLFYTSDYDEQSNEGGLNMLRLTSDKEKYSVGEEMTINIPSNNNCKILLTLESSESIIYENWINGEKGFTQHSIPITPVMTPNVYVHAMLIQDNESSADLPARMYGILPISIQDPNTILNPVLETPKTIKPKTTFTVSVGEKNDLPMSYTLAVVDEGLLGLTRYRTPDLHNHFYAKQSLGVKSWDLYDMVLQGHGSLAQKYISIGGDSDIRQEAGDRKANRFKPVVKFLGPFDLGANQTNDHKIKMDNYIGEVRLMVVAKNNNAYGSAETSIAVKNEIMVLGTMPRVLSPKENFALPVTVFAMNKSIKDIDVSVDLGPGLTLEGDKTQRVSFNKMGETVVYFPISVSEYMGASYIRINGRSSAHTIDQNIEFEISNPNPIVYKVQDKTVQGGASENMEYTFFGIPGSNAGIIEISAFPSINLESRLQFLIRYPYGCIEQTTSSVFPQLYLEDIVELDQYEKTKVNENILNGIKRILSFQLQSGALSYWKGSNEISEWGTSYAGHFLIEAQEKGYYIPPSFWNSWIDFQKSSSRNYSSRSNYHNSRLMQAYRLYTLSRSGNPEWSAMNYLRNMDLDQTSANILAAAYAAAAKPEIARQIISHTKFTPEDYNELSYTYGSAMRDKALVAESFISNSDNPDDNTVALIKEIAEDLGSGNWYSTQSTSFALLAVGKYLSRVDVGSINASITINASEKIEINTSDPLQQIPIENWKEDSGNITIANHADGVLYARLITSGKEEYGKSIPENSNLSMQVKYTDLTGMPINVGEVRQGMDIISEVTIINPGTRSQFIEELALTQVFPSGWEIQNDRITGNTSLLQSDEYEYMDIRDDRVNIFFDLKDKKTFRTLLTATYPGTYYMPDISCHAMYDHKISSRRPGNWVSVTTPIEQ